MQRNSAESALAGDTIEKERRDPREAYRLHPGRLHPGRLLIAFALIAIGLVWSILNSTLWASHGAPPGAPVAHGPVPTRVQVVDGLRVRPVLSPNGPSPNGPSPNGRADEVVVDISFSNGGTSAYTVSPADVYLRAGQRHVLASGPGVDALRPAVIAPGHYVTGALRFAVPAAPGVTIVYTPRWATRHTLHWLLYR